MAKKGESVNDIGGRERAIGMAMIQISFRAPDIIIYVRFMLIEDDILSLLCHQDMVTNRLHISIENCHIRFTGKVRTLETSNLFLLHRWQPTDMSFVPYTESELMKIHRTFQHRSVRETEGLLRRADGGKLTTESQLSIRKIAADWKTCNIHASAPRRFNITVGADDLRFDHTVQIDTRFLLGRPVLHMVDLATLFVQPPFYSPNQRRKYGDLYTKKMWTFIFIGPAGFLTVDEGSSYISLEMRHNLEAEGIGLIQAPIDNPGNLGIVERYPAPLRAAFPKIRADIQPDLTAK